MENKFEDLLKKSTNEYYKEQLNNPTNFENQLKAQISLTDLEILKLANKIENLSFESKTLLMSKYYYKTSPNLTKDLFNIEKPKEKALYLNKTLAQLMGKEGYIDDKSFEKACSIIVEKEEKTEEKGKRKAYPLLKKVAAIFIIVTLSLGLILSTNTKARDKLFNWIIKDHREYSQFIPEKINPDYTEILEISDLEVNYIPDGFELVDIQDAGDIIKLYRYVNENDWIDIGFTKIIDEYHSTNLDTEEATLKEIKINGNDGYIWTHDINYLLWSQNGIEILITSTLSKETIIQIAENIEKK